MNADIRFILENAVRAPSGDNTQPWHILVNGYSIEIWDRSSEDPVSTLYSGSRRNARSLYLAFGAMVENIAIAASVRNYRTQVSYIPDPARPLLAVSIELLPDASITPDPLADALSGRVTNRKPYQRTPLTTHERSLLMRASLSDEGFGEIRLVDARPSIALLARAASLNDELIFGIKDLHEYIFSHINWTKREDARRRIGFYFPTLAAPPFSWGAMQLLRHWWIMWMAIRVGMHRLISIEQRFVYRQAGAYGMVTFRGDTLADWARAGRLVERMWITANGIGLSIHPLNGTLLFASNADTEEGERIFSPRQRSRLKEARESIKRLFDVGDTTIAFMFRIGHANPPSVRTSRLPFERVVEDRTPHTDSSTPLPRSGT